MIHVSVTRHVHDVRYVVVAQLDTMDRRVSWGSDGVRPIAPDIVW
jgi:hypothetical protein